MTLHLCRDLSNALAFRNMYDMSVTELTSHRDISVLNT